MLYHKNLQEHKDIMAATKVTTDFYTLTDHRLSNVSFLKLFNILEESNTKYMNFFRSYSINDNILNNTLYYFTYDVENEDWWDMISFKIYGSSNLWWVICMMNNIINPYEELSEGDQIKVLKESYLYMLLKEIESISEL